MGAIDLQSTGGGTTPDPEEGRAFGDKAVVVREGGPKAVHDVLEAKRAEGRQKTPTKKSVSICLSPEVIEYFKSVSVNL